MFSIQKNYEEVLQKIHSTLAKQNRPPDSVKLLAVCKGQPAKALRELMSLGQFDFGENYVQEWKQKKNELPQDPRIRWHFTGRLQTNKVKDLVGEIALF